MTTASDDAILTIESLSKKFATRLRVSLKYGLRDAMGAVSRRKLHEPRLRPGEFWALHDVSLTIRRGEAVALMGHNGSGKSTLLKLALGLFKPDGGQIRRAGSVAGIMELGAGFQGRLSGRENLEIWAGLQDVDAEEAARLAEWVADFSELRENLLKPVQTYSSGMTARLSLAMALGLKPDLLLIDEALAVGDEVFQRKCLASFRSFLDQGGALLFSSHWPGLVMSLCERALVLENGRTKFLGNVQSAFAQYRDTNVQSAVDNGGDENAEYGLKVTSLTITGADGDEARTGAPAIVKMTYVSDAAITAHWFFIVRTRDRSLCIFSGVSPQPVQFTGEASVECHLPNMPLLPGRYEISGGCFQDIGAPIASLGLYGNYIQFGVADEPSQKQTVASALNQLIDIEIVWPTQ